MNVSSDLRRFLAKLSARRISDRFPNARAALSALSNLKVTPLRRRKARWYPAALVAGGLAIGASGYGVAIVSHRGSAPAVTHASKSSLGLDGADDVALFDSDGTPSLVAYSLGTGLDTSVHIPLPQQVTDAVRDPKTQQWYVIKDETLGELTLPGAFKSLETAAAPNLMNPSALAFDAKRRRLLISAQGSGEDMGEYLFAYEVDSQRWSALTNLGGLTLEALVYNPDEDRLYSVTDAGLVVTFQAENGALVGVRPAPLPVDPAMTQLAVRDGQVLVAHDGVIQKLDAVTGTFTPSPADEPDDITVTDPSPAEDPTDTCDAGTLKDMGLANINMGQHAAALAQFELSLRCKQDPYVISLAFMASCNAQNVAKAKLYYSKLSPMQQQRYKVMCIRNHIEVD